MKLSVIIPCFNAERYIERCLTSLGNQSLDNEEYEIILIDDGSTDNTAKTIEDLKASFRNIIFHKQKNQGQGVARNYGLKLAKGDYIYFLDVDDYIANDSLGIMLSYIQKHDLDVVGFNTIVTEKLDLFDLKKETFELEVNIINGVDYISENRHHRLEAWWYISKRAHLIKTEAVFEEGVFLEDAIFTINVIMHAKRFAHIPLNVHRYITNTSSTMRTKDPKHIKRLINSYVDLILRLNEMHSKISNSPKVYSPSFLENIKYRFNANTLYMFFNIVRSNYTIKGVNNIIHELKSVNVYPMDVKIMNQEFGHPLIKMAVYIFNHKYVLYVLMYPLRLLDKWKIINIP